MTLNLYRLPGGKPLLARVVVVADEFFLLGIHGNDRTAFAQASSHGGADVPKLGVAVRMIFPFLGLPIALQTVVQVVKDLGHLRMTDRVFVPGQFFRDGPVLLQIQRNGDSGSPRVWTSIISSNCSTSPGSETVRGLRPAPGRRMRPSMGANPSSISRIPLDDLPCATVRRHGVPYCTPPWPNALASLAAIIRRVRSSNRGHRERNFSVNSVSVSMHAQHSITNYTLIPLFIYDSQGGSDRDPCPGCKRSLPP